MNLLVYLSRQRRFSERAFGPGKRTFGIIDHICKELEEIKRAPDDLDEWIDVATLALDGAWRAGYTPEQIANRLGLKLRENEQRDWPDWRERSEDEAIEHKRS